MPMGGMPMGGGMGAGAGAAGQQNQEREPQIWMKADDGVWDEDKDNPPPVLGRS